MKRAGTVAQKLGQGADFMPSLNLRFERKFLLLRHGDWVLPQPSIYVLFRCHRNRFFARHGRTRADQRFILRDYSGEHCEERQQGSPR